MGFRSASRPAHGVGAKDLPRLLEPTAVKIDDAQVLAEGGLPSSRPLGERELKGTVGLVVRLVGLDAGLPDLLEVGLSDLVEVFAIVRGFDGGVADFHGDGGRLSSPFCNMFVSVRLCGCRSRVLSYLEGSWIESRWLKIKPMKMVMKRRAPTKTRAVRLLRVWAPNNMVAMMPCLAGAVQLARQ